MGKAGKTGLMNAQFQRAGFFDDEAERRIEAGQMLQPFVDIIHSGNDFHLRIPYPPRPQPAGGVL